MKILLLLSLISFSAMAQDTPILKNDTIHYQSAKFYPNKVVKLAYGSKADKTFAFIYYGNIAAGQMPAMAQLSKQEVLIDKVYKMAGKHYARGKVINGIAQFGMKIFIDIEGAIDNKEL